MSQRTYDKICKHVNICYFLYTQAKLRGLCNNEERSIEMGGLLGQTVVESLMKCVMGLEYDIQGQR